MLSADGYFAFDKEYDEAGNNTCMKVYGTAGMPITLPKGYSIVRRAFDGEKRVIREEYYDISGQPVVSTDGYFAFDKEYDDAGNNTVMKAYGTDDRLIMLSRGYAVVRRVYD